ncbi:MAG TPA: hypothetical protein VN256_02595 [Pyrinomonadaceae bacterium]|nr:hypothetical protein [Pyrinomonadaceae bacterium]
MTNENSSNLKHTKPASIEELAESAERDGALIGIQADASSPEHIQQKAAMVSRNRGDYRRLSILKAVAGDKKSRGPGIQSLESKTIHVF